MAAPTASDITPEIPLSENVDEAETVLFNNFTILRDALKDGHTGTVTIGGHTLTIIGGIITNVT